MRTRFDNALLYDGTGAAPRPGSLLAGDGVIAAVRHADGGDHAVLAADLAADAVIDAQGLALCPGFIDTHSHSDLAVLDEPLLWPKLRQGITTEVYGQDGIAMAPLPAAYVGPWRRNLAGLEGTSDGIAWDFRDMAGYLDLLAARGVGTNVCCLVPHGNVRMEAMGLDARPATDAEIEAMCAILARELEAGGMGLSTGLIYPPCTYSDARELAALCRVAAAHGVPLVIHQRSEADDILASMAEVLALGRDTGVHVHFSHFKLCGTYNEAMFGPMLAMLDAARAEGLAVTFDQYPYVAGSTMLSAILPPWAHAGGTDALLARLRDPEARARMVRDMEAFPCDWDNFVAFAGVDGIFVTNVQTPANRDAVGKSLRELAAMRGTTPLDAALDIILQEENGVSMVDFYGQEKHVEGFLARPEMNVCTDGLMHGMPHPRTYGAFARVLGKYARERGVLPLEEAIRKMTSQPARVFAIPRRGELRQGYFADLVLFDPATVRDTGDYTEPRRHPTGIELVMVNGHVAYGSARILGQERFTDRPSGEVIRLSAPRT
ncbi:MAG: amidohydrolase family protein [Desulfovibrionaceae bacterium]